MNEAADYLNRESTGLGEIFLDDYPLDASILRFEW
jgi:hypothetical protein